MREIEAEKETHSEQLRSLETKHIEKLRSLEIELDRERERGRRSGLESGLESRFYVSYVDSEHPTPLRKEREIIDRGLADELRSKDEEIELLRVELDRMQHSSTSASARIRYPSPPPRSPSPPPYTGPMQSSSNHTNHMRNEYELRNEYEPSFPARASLRSPHTGRMKSSSHHLRNDYQPNHSSFDAVHEFRGSPYEYDSHPAALTDIHSCYARASPYDPLQLYGSTTRISPRASKSVIASGYQSARLDV